MTTLTFYFQFGIGCFYLTFGVSQVCGSLIYQTFPNNAQYIELLQTGFIPALIETSTKGYLYSFSSYKLLKKIPLNPPFKRGNLLALL